MKKVIPKVIDISTESTKGNEADNTIVSTEAQMTSPAPIPVPKVEMVKVSDLKPHPENVRFYGPPKINATLKDNIARLNILQPLVVNADGTTLQGNSRLHIAQILGIEEVPVIRVDVPDRIDQLEMILTGNVQRDKTNEERAREFKGHLEIETVRAKTRQATNVKADASENSKGGAKRKGKGVAQHGKNLAEAETGRARNLAAAKVGWSGPTAENAADVVGVIDELKSKEPNSDLITNLITMLNKSVNSAALECRRKDLIVVQQKGAMDGGIDLKLSPADRSYASRQFKPFTTGGTLDAKQMALLSLKKPASGDDVMFNSLVALPLGLDPLAAEITDDAIAGFTNGLKEATQWNCLIETSEFDRVAKIKWPDNAWVGLVVSTQEQMEKAAKAASEISAKMVWLHCRIDSEGFTIKDLDPYTWVVISLANENVDWVDVEPILKIAHKEKLPVFFDSSVKCRPREMPKLKKAA